MTEDMKSTNAAHAGPQKPKAIKIDSNDNVATVYADITPGYIHYISGSESLSVSVTESIPSGHKVALNDIPENTPIIKYGVTIGVSTRYIQKGSWVHLHNCKSKYDEQHHEKHE